MAHSFIRLAAPGVQGLRPYQPGKPIAELEREYGVTDIVKLASNENPFGPSPRGLQALRAEAANIARYPDGNGFELKQAIARRHDVAPECVTLGNGSNDVLVLLAQAYLAPDLEAVYSRHAFAVYPIAVQGVGAVHREAAALPADSDQPWGHDLTAMAELVTPATRLVFIANPNNPTGTWLDAETLEAFVASLPEQTLAVVDEAYFEYVDKPGYPDTSRWIGRYPNLVVTRTFSKVYGLAGLRVGYALSHPGVADVLNRLRQPFNVNSLAQAAALAALGDVAHVEHSVAMNGRERERVASACKQLGLVVGPSACNFVLVGLQRNAAPVFEALLRRGVIVRPVDNYGLPDHLRISIGTPAENDRLIEGLRVVIAR